MKAIVDNPTPFTHGKYQGLSFNLSIQIGGGESLNGRGFRLMNGMIHPPSIKLGKVYLVAMYLPETFARWVYEALRESGWIRDGITLLPEDIAIEPLLMTTAEAIRWYPEKWQEAREVPYEPLPGEDL